MSCQKDYDFEERSTQGGLPQHFSPALEGISFALGHEDSGEQFGQALCTPL